MEHKNEQRQQGYETAPAPTFKTIVDRPTSTSATSEYTTSHSSTEKKSSTTTGHKSSTSTCTSTTTGFKSSTSTSTSTSSTATNTQEFTFLQLHGSPHLVPEESFLHANFSQICPSQNCFTDCKNLTQVFTATPAAFSNSTDMDAESAPVTLFGVCSNLANVTALVEDHSDAGLKSYFKIPNAADADNDIGLITSNLTMCLVDTCDNTRNPSECNEYCRPDYLFESQDTLAIYPGVTQCAHQLCKSTCGLPYADQDVFGIGVLISYYIQAILLLLMAVAFVISAAVQAWKLSQSPTVSKEVKPALRTFLNTQCYFGASAAVAAFFMDPAHIDPLNGYPLVSVTLMGCIGPVLTLSLLHSHGVRFRSPMALCMICWLLNTIVFFMLVSNLSRSLDDYSIVDRAIRSLSGSSLCGGSSAIVMCREWMGTNPLENLSGFFNKSTFPNISNVSLVWAFTAIVLFILISSRAVEACKGRGVSFKKPPQTLRAVRIQRYGVFHRLAEGLASPWASFVILLLTAMLFSLTLAYEYVMVRAYQEMDVIDTNGWTFGQVVAVLFWVPPLFDATQSLLASLKKRNSQQDYPNTRHKNISLDSYETYRPVAFSPAPSPGIPTRDYSGPVSTSVGQDEQMELRPLQQRRTLRIEEGRN